MLRSVSATDTWPRPLRRWSLTQRLSYDANLPVRLAKSLWQGDADRLLFSSLPLQVKDRCAVARHDCAEGTFLVKHHTWGGFWRTVRSGWREASARRCARIGAYLAEHGISTPRPRAYLEQGIGPFGYRSYIVTDYVEGTDLYQYIRYGESTDAELQFVARQVARIWQRLVELGISHNDMKPENFIVDENLGVWLIDFEKARLGGKARRQRQRQLDDVKNFLHIRGWHHRPAARQIFLNEFSRTRYGEWLGEPTAEQSLEIDALLSVLILCGNGADRSTARRAIDSVRDIADEIVITAPSEGGRLDVIDRIEPCGQVCETPEWILVLHHDEAVTPFLAKELRQRIANRKAAHAFRLPIDHQFFGRNLPRLAGSHAKPIRLFRQDRCSYSLANGALTISVDPDNTDELSGHVEKRVSTSVAEFVDRLNERTTLAADCRFRDGERPRLFRAMLRSFRQFLKTHGRHGGIRSGWTGLQVAFLEAVFTWVEESKLRQMTGEFCAEDAAATAWNGRAAPGAEQQPLSEQQAEAA